MIDNGNPAVVNNDVNSLTHSDHVIDANGNFFYDIERFNHDAVTKFSKDAPSNPIWNYSTMDDEDTTEGITSSNPHQLIFTNSDKAYLIRYGSKRSWVVNTAATSQAEFKTANLDLSSFLKGAGDGTVPEATGGAIVDGKVYVVMQHLGDTNNPWAVVRPGTVAVFNASDDSFVKEIDLELYNPDNSLKVHGGKIYIPCTDSMVVGNGTHGGLAVIDTNNNDTVTKIYEGHKVSNVAIVSDMKGYIVVYNGWGDNDLCSFTHLNGVGDIVFTIDGMTGKNIADITIAPDGKLWVADASTGSAGIYIINPENNTVEQGPLSTNLNPQTIDFFE